MRERSLLLKGLLTLASVLFGVSLAGHGSAFDYIVRPSDTLASIAEKMYGRIQYEKILVAANALEAQGGSPITAGMRLEVPAVSYIRAQKGDRWDALADKLLGSTGRAAMFAEANDTKPWLPPEEGAEIIVPYNLRVITTGKETIVGLAYEFLNDRRKAWMLDHYNDLKGRRLQRGDVLLIPLSELTLTEEGKQAAAAAAQATLAESFGERRLAQAGARAEIPQLIADVKAGRYVDAVTRGTRFLTGEEKLTRAQRAIIHRQLLESYVALGATGQATAACEGWRAHDNSAALNPILMSPKLIAACERAGQ